MHNTLGRDNSPFPIPRETTLPIFLYNEHRCLRPPLETTTKSIQTNKHVWGFTYKPLAINEHVIEQELNILRYRLHHQHVELLNHNNTYHKWWILGTRGSLMSWLIAIYDVICIIWCELAYNTSTEQRYHLYCICVKSTRDFVRNPKVRSLLLSLYQLGSDARKAGEIIMFFLQPLGALVLGIRVRASGTGWTFFSRKKSVDFW